jgi:hypothetical protein
MQFPDLDWSRFRHIATSGLQPGDVFIPDQRWNDLPPSIACTCKNEKCAIALDGRYPLTVYPLAKVELDYKAVKICRAKDLTVRLVGGASGLHIEPAGAKIGCDETRALLRCTAYWRDDKPRSEHVLIDLDSWTDVKNDNSHEKLTWFKDWQFVLSSGDSELVIADSARRPA